MLDNGQRRDSLMSWVKTNSVGAKATGQVSLQPQHRSQASQLVLPTRGTSVATELTGARTTLIPEGNGSIEAG